MGASRALLLAVKQMRREREKNGSAPEAAQCFLCPRRLPCILMGMRLGGRCHGRCPRSSIIMFFARKRCARPEWQTKYLTNRKHGPGDLGPRSQSYLAPSGSLCPSLPNAVSHLSSTNDSGVPKPRASVGQTSLIAEHRRLTHTVQLGQCACLLLTAPVVTKCWCYCSSYSGDLTMILFVCSLIERTARRRPSVFGTTWAIA